jgi:23S rRNA pseudouridine2457 synthase
MANAGTIQTMTGQPEFHYLIFYKPYGVLSQFTDAEGRSTLKDYIPVSGVYAAGRLDYDSEGLLLLTDDGGLIHRMTDPKHHLPKTYLAQVEGVVTDEALQRLEQGVEIQGWRTQPCQAMVVEAPGLAPREKPITPHGLTAWLRLVLHEGKKRQIRHMTAAVGLPTLRLLRVAIGGIGLGDLKPGEWRELNRQESRRLEASTRQIRQIRRG